MFKKIALGVLFAGLIGVLVVGAVVRTIDRTELVAEASGQGQGHEHGDAEDCAEDGVGHGQGQGQGQAGANATGDSGQGLGGNGQGNGGNGQGSGGNGVATRQYPNDEGAPETWLEVEGVVLQSPDDGAELVIQTSDGEELIVGTGPEYMAAQGFSLQLGEQVKVQGYWEDGEFKAGQIVRVSDGQTLTLRDEVGRPAWAGAGRNAQGGNGSQGQGEPADGEFGLGQADAEEWLTLQGQVLSVDANALVLELDGGEQVVVENRAWWFAQGQGFSTQAGNQVTLKGFYDGDQFEVGQLTDNTTGQTVLVREESGRPLWAGGGRRGG